jgi:hypothetical protein
MESEYVEGKDVIAINQSNYPTIVEVYGVDYDITDSVVFGSNADKGEVMSSTIKADEHNPFRVYFEYNGDKYYLDECMTIGCD